MADRLGPHRGVCRSGLYWHFEPGGPNGTAVCLADASDLHRCADGSRYCASPAETRETSLTRPAVMPKENWVRFAKTGKIGFVLPKSLEAVGL